MTREEIIQQLSTHKQNAKAINDFLKSLKEDVDLMQIISSTNLSAMNASASYLAAALEELHNYVVIR